MNASTHPEVNETVLHSREVDQLIVGHPTSDGAGVKLTRVLTQTLHRRLDPFLMLDAFGSDSPNDYIAGFPDHPHRGFETVTYLIAGKMRHRDSAGHEGLLQSGGVQWMTAGRGVIHSEMPEQEHGVLEGFQLWLNLPARDKMTNPWYKDIQSQEIPEFVSAEGVTVRVIAGASHGIGGAVQKPVTEPLYLDLHLPPGSHFAQLMPSGHNAFIYTYRGTIKVGGKSIPEQHLAILSNSEAADGISLETQVASRALLIAGHPLNEPIVQQGPFVMNTSEEIARAISDFRSGRFAI